MNRETRAMILGSGSAAPDKILTNHDMEAMVDTSDEWIRERTGIEQRHILEEGKTNSDMASLAAQRAMEDAGVTAEQIDCILLATVTPDSAFPSTACQVQAKIGAVNAAAFDMAAACSGFLYALTTAESYIASGLYENIVVIGSEVLSRFVDWEDRTTCVLFGDGAGAVVVGKARDNRGILSSFMKSDGRLGDLLKIPGGGSTIPATIESVNNKLHTIQMMGREVFKHAVRTMVEAAKQGLERAGKTDKDLDLLITHQANVRIIDAVAQRLHLHKDQVFVNLQQYGNTSSATIPLAIDQARKEGRLKKNDLCLLVAFGGGFTWGASLVRF